VTTSSIPSAWLALSNSWLVTLARTVDATHPLRLSPRRTVASRLHVDVGGVAACGLRHTVRGQDASVDSARSLCVRCAALRPEVAGLVADVRTLGELSGRLDWLFSSGSGFGSVPEMLSTKQQIDKIAARAAAVLPELRADLADLVAETEATVTPMLDAVESRRCSARDRLVQWFSTAIALDDFSERVAAHPKLFPAFMHQPDVLLRTLREALLRMAPGLPVEVPVDEFSIVANNLRIDQLPATVDQPPSPGVDLRDWLSELWRRAAFEQAVVAASQLSADITSLVEVGYDIHVEVVTAPLNKGMDELYVAWMPVERGGGLVWNVPLLVALWLERLPEMTRGPVTCRALPGALAAEFVLRHDDRRQAAAAIRLAHAIVAH
jgi:hypothetical protein